VLKSSDEKAVRLVLAPLNLKLFALVCSVPHAFGLGGYRQSFDLTTLMDFIPSANALSNVSSFTREMIGPAYYNLKF
jgi:hypothetical protein